MKLMTVLASTLILASCSNYQTTEEDRKLLSEAKDYFSPVSHVEIHDKVMKEKIALGKKLYFEKALSPNNKISCNSCHNLSTFGVDNEATSPGHNGIRGNRNSPTTLNASLHKTQFWDGRAKDVEEQALGPLLNPIEHGLKDSKEAMAKLSSKEYMAMFKSSFPKEKKPFKFINIGKAIGAFERTLITPSRFDQFLEGDYTALDSQEKAGLQKFIQIGCTQCHSGQALGGQSFEKLGKVHKYKTKDLGRYEVTKKRRDKYKFKVPSLRNISKTSPYLHDGSLKSLDETIEMMAYNQLGKKLNKDDIKSIKAFLNSLTGELPSL